jgi:predicted amidophosphoribosyltransferase
MAVLTCQCGAKVRVPDDSPGPFRCPRCRTAIHATAPATIGAVAVGGPGTTSPTGTDVTGMCAICQSGIAPGEASMHCPSCGQLHHQECWDEVGGCAVYGCQSAPQTTKEAPTGPALSAWGDVKSCPMCGEQIKAIALRCRFCGADFETVDPLSAYDMHNKFQKELSSKTLRTSAIALFIASMIGLIAPLTLLISVIWVPLNRKRLKQAGPALLVLGYASIALSSVFCLLMLILIASS